MAAKKHGNNKITYEFGVVPTAHQVIELHNDAGLPTPKHDPQRIRAMFENSDLIVTAWDENKLVGCFSYSYNGWRDIAAKWPYRTQLTGSCERGRHLHGSAPSSLS